MSFSPKSTNENDAQDLLRSISPRLMSGVFAFATVPEGMQIPIGLSPLMTFRETEGTTLIIEVEAARRAGLHEAFRSRWIALEVNSALDAVGFLATITAKLAQAGIAVNAVSAFHHDHLFVPEARADEALELLLQLSRS